MKDDRISSRGQAMHTALRKLGDTPMASLAWNVINCSDIGWVTFLTGLDKYDTVTTETIRSVAESDEMRLADGSYKQRQESLLISSLIRAMPHSDIEVMLLYLKEEDNV